MHCHNLGLVTKSNVKFRCSLTIFSSDSAFIFKAFRIKLFLDRVIKGVIFNVFLYCGNFEPRLFFLLKTVFDWKSNV